MKAKDLVPSESKGLSRRQLLKLGTATGAGLIIGSRLLRGVAIGQPVCNVQASSKIFSLTPFKDPLPIPVVKKPFKRDAKGDHYQVVVKDVAQLLHSEMPAKTPVWGYDGLFPGPTIEATVNRKVFLTVENALTKTSYLTCVDRYIEGANVLESDNYAGPMITTHLHGGNVEHIDDGWPDFRYGPGVSFTYEYPNIQLPTTLWYHDHGMAVTRLNVYSGLAAFYILRDSLEARLALPKGLYTEPGNGFEVPIVIQDRSFNDDGTLWFAGGAGGWEPEFFGDYPVVNGMIQPYLEVTQSKYRFRFLNGCNARFLNLSLSPAPQSGIHFVQIGTDGGLLPAPVSIKPVSVPLPGTSSSLNQVLLMAPAERCDVIIDFSQFDVGTNITLSNDAPGPFPGGDVSDPASAMSNVMQFRVVAGRKSVHAIPARLRTMPANPAPSVSRFITLVDHGSPMFGTNAPNTLPPDPACPAMPVNNQMHNFAPGCDGSVPATENLYPTLLINNQMWMEPPTETPKVGATEVWYWINTAPDTHPMHMHQVQFKVLGRQSFDLGAYLEENPHLGPGNNVIEELAERDPRPFMTGTTVTDPEPGNNTVPPLIDPDENEKGWKDTVRCPPGMVTVTLATFGPFKGPFPYHCHILDHEDNDMMRWFMVTS